MPARGAEREGMMDIKGAEKKLRQAMFFLRHLERASAEPIRRAQQMEETEHLEYFFSACLSAAQSVYYVLIESGGTMFKALQRDWRENLEGDSGGSRFGTVRKARNAKGTATDHEQDLLRAALVFAAAGLDSMVKQLVRDALHTVVAKEKGAHAQFADYVQSRLKRMESIDLRFLAEAIASEHPSNHLKQELTKELTGSSLQSKDQLLRVAAYFAIPANEITKDPNKLKMVFETRNQIAHEMDILFGQTNRGRRQRKYGTMSEYTTVILTTAVAFYSAVAKRL